MTTWYTSDLHLGHAKISSLAGRPFADLDYMNTELIRRWVEHVSPDDTVFCLGDMVMGQRETTLPMLSQLTGHKVLIHGNHDYCTPWLWKASQAEKAQRWMDAYSPYFERIVESETRVLANGTEVFMCHFPYSGDSHGEDRYSERRPVDEGKWLLHGHTHQKERLSGPRQIHVGVDAWSFSPVSEEEVIDLIEANP